MFQEGPAFLCSSCANEKTSKTWNSTNSKRIFYFFSITKIPKSRNLTRPKRFYSPRKIPETKDSIISKKAQHYSFFFSHFSIEKKTDSDVPTDTDERKSFLTTECFSFPTFSHFAWFAKVTARGQKAVPLDSLSSNFFWSWILRNATLPMPERPANFDVAETLC